MTTPNIFDCGCSRHKVAEGLCDIYAPDGSLRVADTIPAPPPVPQAARPKRHQGFAVMPREVVSELARKGGKAAQATGRAHVFTSAEASAAGKLGGRVTGRKAAERRAQRALALGSGGEGGGS